MGSVRDDHLYDGVSMRKPGIAIEIPGFGERVIHTVISDYTGTLSCHGKLSPGVRPLLLRLARLVDIEIITADTYATAHQQLKEIVLPHMLRTKRQDVSRSRHAGISAGSTRKATWPSPVVPCGGNAPPVRVISAEKSSRTLE